MCGVAGFTGIKSAKVRSELVDSLGIGIDNRGGHAAGYVSLVGGTSYPLVRMAKTLGTWLASSPRFRHTASVGETCMMHTRFATCGQKDDVDHAHPWAIRRGRKAVLYGCHNGVLSGTWTSARENGRKHTVDSRELLELIADGDHDAVRKLDGYGVVTWVVPGSSAVHLLRLSKQSDISCMAVEGGGIVWASTWTILKEALEYADLKPLGEYTLPDIGQVYAIYPDRVEATSVTGLKVNDYWSSANWDSEDYAWPVSGTRTKYSNLYKGDHVDHGYLSDEEEIDADILAKAEDAKWDTMTSAEWERWGRWAGMKPPEPLLDTPCGCRVGQRCTLCWDSQYRDTPHATALARDDYSAHRRSTLPAISEPSAPMTHAVSAMILRNNLKKAGNQ